MNVSVLFTPSRFPKKYVKKFVSSLLSGTVTHVKISKPPVVLDTHVAYSCSAMDSPT